MIEGPSEPTVDVCYNLGDNPVNRLSWSVVSGRIPTFRLSPHIYFFPTANRWLSVLEKLSTMGWPVYPSLAQAANLSLVLPSRQEARHMLGNAMHLPSAALVLASAMAATAPVPL